MAMKIWGAIRRLLLGILLIALSSGVLLLSDWSHRRSGDGRVRRLALLQHASQSVIDEGVRGMLDGLAENGFIDGKNIVIRRFNAENDLPTANAIARQITNGEFDLVLTASTLSLQTVANANKAGRTIHVFGIVADPFGAGVGISRDNPLNHPKHLVGIGSFIPVDKAFGLAKQSFPGLKSVGVVWNPTESNSEAFTRAARKACQPLGIQLLEANIESSSGVFEAANSLVSRGVQALWVGGDVTVLVALDSVIAAAKKGRIPVFSIIPPSVTRGTLFDRGANFYEIGKQTGHLAAQVLNGADPAKIPVTNYVPEKLAINRLALADLRDPWRLPEELFARADTVVDERGVHQKSAGMLRPPPARMFKVGVVYFAPEEGADLCLKGLFDGLRELAFVEGKNLSVRKAHAQGEIANIPSLLQNYDNEDVDLIVTLTTPCLTSACHAVKKKPVIFTYVYDPIAAGVGKSRTDHLPHVTGVGSFPPVGDTIDLIQTLVPGVKAVGTLYNSSEANSRKVVEVARDLFTKRGIKLQEVTVTGTSEVFQAAQVLARRGIQAMWITGDNTAIQSFEGIAKVAADSRLPLIINDPEFTQRGALACVGLGWYQAGYAASKLAGRVLLGESPQSLPVEEVAVKKIVLNQEVAQKLGVRFPPALLQEANR
jgi:ABC-type uncharacterized transport system substrate-binding protein